MYKKGMYMSKNVKILTHEAAQRIKELLQENKDISKSKIY